MNNRYKKSYKLWEQGKKSLIQGSITLSKDPHVYTFGAYPVYIKSGKGSRVIDVDGNEYIDFQSGLGAVILGHAYEPVVDAVTKQLHQGSLMSFAHPLTVTLAERLQKIIPGAERVRLVKSGSDATSLAVRIARAYTKKDLILAVHYHGWHDWYYILSTSNNRGVPAINKTMVMEAPYNNLEKIEQLLKKNKVAAIILEPVNLEPPKDNYLKDLVTLMHKHNALVIFDEVVTGFRFALGGAQSYYHVIPDICCFSKALGNGMPIGATCGLAGIMENTADVASSMTFGEESASIAGALATLDILETQPVSEHIWKVGELLQQSFNQLTVKSGIPIRFTGLPPRMEISFKDYKNHKRLELKAFFLQETAKKRILFGDMICINYSHTEADIMKAIVVTREVIEKMIQLNEQKYPLEGELPVELW